MKVSKWMVLVVCLVAFSVLIAGCGKKTPSTKDPGKDPTPDPPQETQLELNAGEELAALQALSLPGTHKGFTFGSKIQFEENTKTYEGVDYTARIKLGGSDPIDRGITFTAKEGDTLTILAMSASGTGTGRHLMVAPVGGTGQNLGEVHTTDLLPFTYKLPADGEYVVYSSTSGINIYYISVFTNPPSAAEPKILSTNVNDPAMGSVNVTPQKDAYSPGETVTLEAVANDGYQFKQWSGDLTGSTNPVTITMDEDKTITAEFIAFTPQALPYTEDFETEYENFWTPEYKSLPADPTAPMYYPTSGESKMSIEEGVLYIGDARFTIGELAPYTPTKSGDTATNGVFDLSKPYKISFDIVSIEGSGKKLQVYINNNTSGAANSIHGNSSRIYDKKVEEHEVDQTVEILSDIGTETSFINIRVESGVKVGIDNLVIEYQ